MPITTAIFDAYGTLFDVGSAARQAAKEPEYLSLKPIWAELANDWRLKQLQYTWLRAIADEHCDFWQVTQDGLDWALEKHGITQPDIRDRLLELYHALGAYAEVPQVLETLKAHTTQTGILSNGSPDMLDAAVQSAGIEHHIDAVLSVEDVKIFKPARQVYDLVASRFNTRPSEVLFVSSNGWDVAGAAHYGFTTVWVNRTNEPQDRLFAKPTYVMSDLTGIPSLMSSTEL